MSVTDAMVAEYQIETTDCYKIYVPPLLLLPRLSSTGKYTCAQNRFLGHHNSTVTLLLGCFRYVHPLRSMGIRTFLPHRFCTTSAKPERIANNPLFRSYFVVVRTFTWINSAPEPFRTRQAKTKNICFVNIPAMSSELIRPYSVVNLLFVLLTPGDSLHAFQIVETSQYVTKSDAIFALYRPSDIRGQEAISQLADNQSIFPTPKAHHRCCSTLALGKFVHNNFQSVP